MVKLVNEYFFDQESKEMYYLLGTAYASYAPPSYRRKMVLFRNSNKNLIEIIRNELQSDHEIIPDNRGKSSYFLSFTSPHMRFRLEKIGLSEDKEKRLFPRNINGEYLSHFVRGFFDAQGYIDTDPSNLNRISFYFYKNFLDVLCKLLSDNAGIKKENVNKYRGKLYYSIYGHNNSLKIYDFIYQDFHYVKERGLFLQAKKDLFNLNRTLERSPRGLRGGYHLKRTIEKIEESKKLILECNKTRGKFKDIANKLGYNRYPSFLQAFKSVVGLTPREFLKSRSNN